MARVPARAKEDVAAPGRKRNMPSRTPLLLGSHSARARGLAVVAALGAWACTPAAAGTAAAPSDDELRMVQAAHGAELEELRAAIESEKRAPILRADRIGECERAAFPEEGSWTCVGEPGAIAEADVLARMEMTEARWTRYRELLGAVGARGVSRRAGLVTVMFSRGGATKDLVWTGASAPGHLVHDTDDRAPGFAVVYARAADGWYVERDVE